MEGRALQQLEVERPVDISMQAAGVATTSGKVLDGNPTYPCAKLKLDQLFLQWLSLPDSQQLVNCLIEDAKAGKPIKGPSSNPSSVTPLSPTTHAIFASTPPLSPQKCRSPRSPLSPRRPSGGSTLKRAPLTAIPQFYYPRGPPVADDVKSQFLAKVDALFGPHPAGLNLEQFSRVVQEVCQLPTILAHPWFERLATPAAAGASGAAAAGAGGGGGAAADTGASPPPPAAAGAAAAAARLVTRSTFVDWWLSRGLATAPPMRRLWEVLRRDGVNHLTYDDFRPLLHAVLQYHPGLEFLGDTPEFQARYAETVIYRIFYSINRTGSGRMTFRELRRSDLLDALVALEREEDINRVTAYFSYEHFYVVYCKFWELDTDHDFQLDRDDLARYANCALTYQIVERIFEQAPRRFSAGLPPGKMGYEDFVWFILSEEDKTTDTALEYWFRCVDLDYSGVVTPSKMWHFYEEQMKRLEATGQEPVLFEDVLCQLHDMLQPSLEGAYTLADLKATRPHSGLFFNTLFNLPKFLQFENRDPFAMRAEALGEEGAVSDWDRFASVEYLRLAVEDEPEEMQVDGSDDVWGAAATAAGAGGGAGLLDAHPDAAGGGGAAGTMAMDTSSGR